MKRGLRGLAAVIGDCLPTFNFALRCGCVNPEFVKALAALEVGCMDVRLMSPGA